ncbi:nucleotidyltransferase family protein [Aliikangiella coralliicola]|uniref:Nucleotidyltransferase family protein n=2 Tax=Aliikangiella coralliicola TaxID=2592383 RepID=A0A545UER4_9GAMM|nr:nucleotidyltransferase family protein [Aliikangiella coralliicola]
MDALTSLRTLNLPDCYIAAGFVRNLIWDYLFSVKSSLNDIDVIYFCPRDISEQRDKKLEEQLSEIEPSLPWSVKNQARMHIKNGDRPYKNSLDAMSYWPEKQTCIGVRLNHNDELILAHCFSLSEQFNGKITFNPKRNIQVFRNRISRKTWLKTWPDLVIED